VAFPEKFTQRREFVLHFGPQPNSSLIYPFRIVSRKVVKCSGQIPIDHRWTSSAKNVTAHFRPSDLYGSVRLNARNTARAGNLRNRMIRCELIDADFDNFLAYSLQSLHNRQKPSSHQQKSRTRNAGLDDDQFETGRL